MAIENSASMRAKHFGLFSIMLFVVSVGLMAWLRLVAYPDQFVTLTYGLPLLLCLWHRDIRLLWGMAASFVAMATYKNFVVLPELNLDQWAMQTVNTIVIASVVHAVVTLTRRLLLRNVELSEANENIRRASATISKQNDQLVAQTEELKSQAEELQSQSEELEQQNEELQQQSEELEQQREELQEQNEELQGLNFDMRRREDILQVILDSVHAFRGEDHVMESICQTLLNLLDTRASAVTVVEHNDGQLHLRAQAGLDGEVIKSWPLANSFASVVMEHGATAYVDDLDARPDFMVPCARQNDMRSVLASPVLVQGRPHGVVKVFSKEPQYWTRQEFALVEWVAAQCASMIETVRLQDSLREREEELRRVNMMLEQRVKERTKELNRSVVALRDEVEKRAEIELELRGRSEQLRTIAAELTTAEQRERQRLAQVLHDGLQQILAGAKLRLKIAGQSKPEAFEMMLAEVDNLLDEAIETSRSLTIELCPPILRKSGLVAALDWLTRWMQNRHKLNVELSVCEEVRLSEDMKILVFQSVREMLFNVIKHAAVRSARVEMTREGDHLQVRVIDEGCGFDAEAVQSKDGSGGFGLFTIRERLNLQGGQLLVESQPMRGSIFTILAPIGEATTQAPITEAEFSDGHSIALGIAPADDNNDRERIHVLLADDHLVMRQGLALLIKGESDMEVVGEASDGQSAVRLAKHLRPDVVLMDLSMPVMNGAVATRTITKDLPEIKVIGLSMFEEIDGANDMRDAGAVAYLTKSGPSELVLAAIRRAVTEDEILAD